MISRPAVIRSGSSASKVTVRRCPHCLKATLISKFNEHLALCADVQRRNPSLNSQISPIPPKQGSNQFRIKQSPNIRKSEEPVLNRTAAQRMTERIMVGQKPQRPFHASKHTPANNISDTNPPRRQPVSVNRPNGPCINGDTTTNQEATKPLENIVRDKAEKEKTEKANRQKVESQQAEKQKLQLQRQRQRQKAERAERAERQRIEIQRIERAQRERERERERGRVAQEILAEEMRRTILVAPLGPLHSHPQSVSSEQSDVAQMHFGNVRDAQEPITQLSTLAQNSLQIIAFVQSLGMQNDERMHMGIQQLRQLIFISRQVSELSTMGHSLYNGIGNVFADRIRRLQATIVQQIGNILMLGFQRRITSQFQIFARQAVEKKVGFTEEQFDTHFTDKLVIEECQCPICLGNILAEVVELQCAHLFHRDCIKEWLRESTRCPMCRREQLKV